MNSEDFGILNWPHCGIICNC